MESWTLPFQRQQGTSENERHWPKKHIYCKGPCKRFLLKKPEDASSDPKCQCGRVRSDHNISAVEEGKKAAPGAKWCSDDCDEVPTDAYGKITFLQEDTDQTPDFIRASVSMCETDDGLDTIFHMMTDESLWGLDEYKDPNLLISVTGGAQDFKVDQELKSNFAKGLCAAAKSANAWIITGGTDTGVMKIVGDAVYDYPGEIITIGIATWGIVRGKDQLIRKRKLYQQKETERDETRWQPKLATACFDYDGSTDDANLGSTALLNPHHTHFIFVDDGKDMTYGGEMDFRAKLERRIVERYTKTHNEQRISLPIIQIVLNGGPNSAKTCYLSMIKNIPLLVIKGSGNCADVIAKAYSCSYYVDGRRKISEVNRQFVVEEIENFFANASDYVKETILDNVLKIIEMDHLLTIYSLDSQDLDHALLFALIRSKTDANSAIEQMSMAVKWNRKRLAEDIIAMENVQFQRDQYSACLEQAILHDRKDFIEIFIRQGVEMKTFLTYDTLERFYRHKPVDTTHLGKKRFFKIMQRLFKVDRADLTLWHVGNLLTYILEGTFHNPFKETVNEGGSSAENPYDQLLIYSALNDCKEMADYLWKYCHSPITTALIAFRIYNFHAEYTTGLTAYDNESEQAAVDEALKFELYACKSLSKCPKLFDKEDTFLLLSAKHGYWSGQSLVNIAYTVKSDKFLAHGAVQNYLTDKWRGELHSSESRLKIILCSPFPLPLLLHFEQRVRTNEQIQDIIASQEERAASVDPEHGQELTARKTLTRADSVQKTLQDKLRKYQMTWYQKVYAFYNAPLVKFQWSLFWLFVFLGIYGYTLTIKHSSQCALSATTSVTWYELYLLMYVIGTLPTEILQIVRNNARKPVTKIMNHYAGFFNILDGLAIIAYLTAIIIKLTTSSQKNTGVDSSVSCAYVLPTINVYQNQAFTALNLAHILHVFSFMFYVARFMESFKISSQMGPKVLMIFAMIKDLVFFILILLLFVFCYSIGAQAIIRPNKTDRPFNSDYMFHLLFYRPYLMAMGEFGMEDFIEDFKRDHCIEENHCDSDDFELTDLLEISTIASVHYYIFVSITIVYIMIANILLVNLLIAIFSHTYEALEGNSQELYKVQRAEMIMEYEQRVSLPNPFSLIQHTYMFIRFMIKYIRTSIKGEKRAGHVDPSYHKMTKIERACIDEYLLHKDEEDEGFVKDTLIDLKARLKDLQTSLDNSGIGGGMGGTRTSHEVSNEQQERRPLLKTLTQAIKKVAIGSPIQIHEDSRFSPYPQTTVERTVIADDKVPWSVSWPDYSPVEYTKQRKGSNPVKYDVEQLSEDLVMSFNKNNVARSGINRVSFMGLYDLEEFTNRPINPRGRTGLRGKGKLKRWGPNHEADVIVTRWKRNKKRHLVTGPNGKQVLEFVAIKKHKDDLQWAIPGGMIRPGEKLVDTLEREFSVEALGALEMGDEEKKKCMEMVEKHFGLGITVYHGYVDDPRNTDNSWVETTALNYHDSDGTSFAHFPLDVGMEFNPRQAKWITLDQNIDLYANHEWMIEKVCFHRNAYCPITKNTGTDAPRMRLGRQKSEKWGFIVETGK